MGDFFILPSMGSKMKKYIWPLLISMVLGIFVYLFPNSVEPNSENYILSSIAQGFSSLLALLFVIMFFLYQSTERVSMLEQILKPDGYLLLSIFIITILLPLIVLKIGINDILVCISITIAAFCLFALYTFLRSVNKSIKELGIISNISKIPSLNVDYRNKLETQKIIDDLLVFSSREIVEISPDEVISIFVDVLGGRMQDDFYPIFKRKEYMTMLSELSSFSFILKDNKKIIKKAIVNHYGYLLEHNWKDSQKERDVLFGLSLEGIFKILSELNKYNKTETKIKSLISISLVKTAFLIKKQIYDGKNGGLGKKSELIELKIEEIYKYNYLKWEDLNAGIDGVTATEEAAERKEIFREELKKRLGVEG